MVQEQQIKELIEKWEAEKERLGRLQEYTTFGEEKKIYDAEIKICTRLITDLKQLIKE